MEARGHGVSKPRSLALEKMETLVRQMQSTDSGVPVRCQKLFLTTIPSAFMGYDLIEWLMENLPIDDSAEALHLASLLCQHGYFFPVGDAKTLQVKDDSSLYRFQTPYYWPSQNHVPDSTDYAIYLHKKIAKNKQKHGLEDCELEGYNQLKKTLASKWDFVTMQADEQLKMAKDRKKGDKIVSESQERAYWRVYRPPPGFTNTLELPPVPDKSLPPPGSAGSAAALTRELNFLQLSLGRLRIKISQVAEGMITHHETYLELDPFLSPVQPSNPWFTDDPTFMELNEPLVEFPTERRLRRWAISMEETVSDPTGLCEFTACMRKEFSHENIRFWSAVHQLKKMPLSKMPGEVTSIYDEFLRPGAPCEINIDGKTMERTQELLKNPTRFTYDYAADHIFDLLLKKDCYPRFLRSEHYKNLLTNATNPTSKKRFFTFGAPGKKKISSVTPPNINQLAASSGRLSNEDQSAVANAAAGGGTRPDCDPPYRGDMLVRDRPRTSVTPLMEEDAGIFLGGPATPPPSVRAPPAPSPSPSPCPARTTSDGTTAGVSSALVPVSTAAAAVVPCTLAAPASAVVPTPVSAPVTAASSSSTAAPAVASSSAPTSSISTSTPAIPASVAESPGLPATSKDSGQGSGTTAAVSSSQGVCGSAAAVTSSASGPGAAAGKANSAGPAATGSAGSAATGSAAAAKGPSASSAAGASPGSSAGPSTGPSPTSAPAASAAASSAAGAPAGVSAPAEAAQISGMPPVDPPPVAAASLGMPGAPARVDEPLQQAGASAAVKGCSRGTQSEMQQGAAMEGSAAAAGTVSGRGQVTPAPRVPPLCPPPSAGGDTDSSSGAWSAAIAPPAMFQDMTAPLATIDERDEPTPPPHPPQLSPSPETAATSTATASASEPEAAAGAAAPAAGATAGSGSPASVTAHTEMVTLTDRCAQTVETGDSVDYGSTTDKQCEANLTRDRGTRRKEKRVKICVAPAAAAPPAAAASATGSEAATADEAAKRRSRSASADAKRERKESKARREPRKKSSSERRRARLEDRELDGASPKRGDVVAPAAGEPAPQKLDESSVCPWENEENCRLDTPFVKTYATLGYL